jgi:competence protein ComFC
MKMSAFEYISYALFPRRCALCGKVVPPDMPVCDRCEADLEYVKGELCPRCGREKKYCSCSSHRRFFESQTAPFYYSGAAKRSVHALKFDGCVQNAVGLARFMSDSVKNNFAGVKFDFVCCVPLSESSLKKRGYNQSALLAKEIAKELGVPFEEKLLSRPFQGKEQKTLGGIERFGGVIGAFDCAENKIIESAAVLLCDDISTTGATLNECAKLLLLCGADKVYCVSAAITKKEDGKCSEQTSE